MGDLVLVPEGDTLAIDMELLQEQKEMLYRLREGKFLVPFSDADDALIEGLLEMLDRFQDVAENMGVA